MSTPPEFGVPGVAWRRALLSALAPVIVVAPMVGIALGAFTLRDAVSRTVLVSVGGLAVAVLAIALRRGWADRAVAWLVVAALLSFAVVGFFAVGPMAGPASAFMVAVLTAGLLVGRPQMVAVLAGGVLAYALIAWATVSGHLLPPPEEDRTLLALTTWIRAGGIMLVLLSVAAFLVTRAIMSIEDALARAQREMERREQADRERVDAERAALQSQKLEVVGQLAAGVAHDFNNSLAAILGAAELASSDLPGDSPVRPLLDTIVQAAQRSSELTRQLLAFSRKAKVRTVALDLHDVIRSTLTLIEHSFPRNMRVETHLDATSTTVLGDPALLSSALLNLALNARDAMADGGLLTISTRTLTAAATADLAAGLDWVPHVEISVRDTGPGVPADLRERVFEPFFTTKPPGAGTGLGLAAVLGTVRSHKGSVMLVDAPGPGAEFRLLLPICAAPVAPAREPSTPPAERGLACVLLVDDEPLVRKSTGALLRRLGYEVILAEDGESAVAALERDRTRIALVMLDMVMPGMGGPEAFARMRRVVPGLPVLLCSGYSAEGRVEELLSQGAAGFLPKPFRLADLSEAVKHALGTATPAAAAR